MMQALQKSMVVIVGDEVPLPSRAKLQLKTPEQRRLRNGLGTEKLSRSKDETF